MRSSGIPATTKGAALPDMEPGGERRMVCVEAAAVQQPVTVAAGARWSGTQRFRAAMTMTPPEGAASAFLVRAVRDEHDVAEVRRLVLTHAAARATTPGVEYMRADADRMPGPYVPPRGGLWLAVYERDRHRMRGAPSASSRTSPRSSGCSWTSRGVAAALDAR